MLNYKGVMDKACQDLQINDRFLHQCHTFAVGFVNRNEDHIRFFGGNLTGVWPIRFLSADRYTWLEDIVGIDDLEVKRQIVSLPGVKEEWKRATDMVNISCVYLVHRLANNNDLTPGEKEQGMTDILLIMQYKLLCSLMSHYFPYPADEATAMATYAALTKKFAIKQAGSWQALLLARCKDVISKQSIHYQTIIRFDDDDAIRYMISDIQIRLRAIIKNLWEVFDKVRRQDSRILTTGGKVELDGAEVVRDVSRNFPPYKRYLNEIVTDPRRFIKQEIVQVIGDIMHTMPEKLLIDTLAYVSKEAAANNKDVDNFLNEVMLHAFDFLGNDSRARETMKDLNTLISKLRGLYMASRSTDPSLLLIRNLGEKIVGGAIKSKNTSVIAAVRTGLSLYVVTRTFAKDYYK